MVTKTISALCMMGLSLGAFAGQPEQKEPAAAEQPQAKVVLPWEETDAQRDARMQWWRDAKFGMFIHYGLYSGLGGFFKGQFGGGEWIQRNLRLDTDTYAAEALPKFKPAPGCTEAWAELAAYAGCKYAVLTTKHHEGFGLFDTDSTDYCAGKAVGRDIVREFVDSFRKRGIKIGFYHSVIDWHHPSYDNTICPDLCYPEDQEAMLKQKGIPRDQEAYLKYLHGQVRELLTKYGDISVLWWDYSQGAAEGDRAWKATELMTMAHTLQPGIIMNNRLYNLSGFDASRDGEILPRRHGDYTSPEKRIPAKGYPGVDWEACMTVGDKWGYCQVDLNFKSPQEIIAKLEECTAKNGNLLLSIPLNADGEYDSREAAVLDGRGLGQLGVYRALSEAVADLDGHAHVVPDALCIERLNVRAACDKGRAAALLDGLERTLDAVKDIVQQTGAECDRHTRSGGIHRVAGTQTCGLLIYLDGGLLVVHSDDLACEALSADVDHFHHCKTRVAENGNDRSVYAENYIIMAHSCPLSL